jgi:hypothetical protein
VYTYSSKITPRNGLKSTALLCPNEEKLDCVEENTGGFAV